MRITTLQGNLIRSAKGNGKTVHQTARAFAMPSDFIKMIYEGREPSWTYDVPIITRDATTETIGPAHMRPFLLASKTMDANWPVDPAITKAHRDYDEGLIDMVQGRSTNLLFLYAIPRKHRDVKRQPYFSARPIDFNAEDR